MRSQIKNFLLKGEIAIIGGLVFLFLCPFLLIFEKEATVEKIAAWAYTLLVIGTTQLLINFLVEERKSAKKEKK